MPNEGVINNAKAKAVQVQDLAKKVINILHELDTIRQHRENGAVDFAAIDYPNDQIFGHLTDTDFNKALDEAKDSISNWVHMFKVVR